MAVPTLKAGDRKALPAFTSTASLALWDPEARPVAVPLHQALAAAAHEQADTIVLDLAGPVPYEINRSALIALSEGRRSQDPLSDPAVTAAVRAVVAAEPAVRRAYLGAGSADGTLALVIDPSAAPGEAAQRVARHLAADETLRARLVSGLDLALLLLPRRRHRASPFTYVRCEDSAEDRARVLLARTLTRLVRHVGGLAEGQLQRLQAVAQRAAWNEEISVALASMRPAREWISLRASSRSLWPSPPSARPRFTAAALIRWTATVVITSTAGTSAMSRVRVSKSGESPAGDSGVGVASLMSHTISGAL